VNRGAPQTEERSLLQDGPASPTDRGQPPDAAPSPRPEAAPDLPNSPTACGPAKLDCGGRACLAGVCEPEILRTAAYSYLVAEGKLYSNANGDESKSPLREGPLVAGGADVPIMLTDPHPTFVQAGVAYASEYHSLVLYDLTTKTRTDVPGTVLDYQPYGGLVYAIDYYTKTPRVFDPAKKTWSALAGAPTTLNCSAIQVDAQEVFLRCGQTGGKDVLRRFARDGSGELGSPVVGIPSSSTLQLTPGYVVGVTVSSLNPVSCASTTLTVWAVPRSGGPLKTLTSFVGFFHDVLAADGFVYYYHLPCGAPSPTPLKRIDLTSGGEIEVARDLVDHARLYVEGNHLYYAPQFGVVARVPR